MLLADLGSNWLLIETVESLWLLSYLFWGGLCVSCVKACALRVISGGYVIWGFTQLPAIRPSTETVGVVTTGSRIRLK